MLLRLEVNHIAVGQLKDLDINILATEVCILTSYACKVELCIMWESFFALSISVENRLQAELYISLLFSAYSLLALGGFEALKVKEFCHCLTSFYRSLIC